MTRRNARINDLEAKAIAQDKRLRELEDNQVKDCSVWRPDRVYGRGSMVTLKGSLWIAEEATAARPGDPDDAARAWRLAVKRGLASTFAARLEALPFKFPLRVTLKGFDERKRLSDAAGAQRTLGRGGLGAAAPMRW